MHTPVWFQNWIRDVIDGLGIHNRENWGHVLGTSKERIDDWVDKGELPEPRHVNSIIILLNDRYSERAKNLLDTWLKEANVRVPGYRTFGEWALEPVWENVRMAIHGLPSEEQRKLLDDFHTRIMSARYGS